MSILPAARLINTRSPRQRAPQADFLAKRNVHYAALQQALAAAATVTGYRWTLCLDESGISLYAGVPGVLVPDVGTAVAEASLAAVGRGPRTPSTLLLSVSELLAVEALDASALAEWAKDEILAATHRNRIPSGESVVATWTMPVARRT